MKWGEEAQNDDDDENLNKQARLEDNPATISNSTLGRLPRAASGIFQPIRPSCATYGKNHVGECLWGQGKCFR